MRLLWLPKVLRAAGLGVIELPGWETRGRPNITPQGVVAHHTATGPNVRDEVVDKLLAVGRPDLAGPLSQTGLRRSGVWVVVASGRANHNGYGLWGNDSIGVEAYNDGRGEPWPDVQMKSYAAGVAAICAHQGWGPERVKGHKETDPRRKIDPTFDMGAFRAAVASRIKTKGDQMSFTEEDRRLLRDLHFAFVGARRFGGDQTAHDLATPILNANHYASQVIPTRISTLTSRVSDLRLIAETAASPEEVAGIVDAALAGIVDALEGLRVDGEPITKEQVRRLLIELLEQAE